MSRIIKCGECKKILINENEPCENCGSSTKAFEVMLEDTITIHDVTKGKGIEPGLKKPRMDFKIGDDYFDSRQKFVHKKWILDRKNDKYIEIVVDKETGEVIHQCEEPLSDHQNRGSAKHKND